MGLQGDGMGSRDSSWATALLSSIQRAAGVYGAAGEIGVHHGYFWMSVALTARVGEKLFALDLFERNQDKNVDASGGGNMGIFKHNARTLGFPEQDIVIVEGMSSSITPGQLCSKIGYGFRFLSIDGGHTKEILLNDMKFAECCLQDGGIAALDDYSNAFWPGVHEGIVSYFDRHGAASRLAPFLLHANKLYVTTRSHHKRYLDAVTSQPFWRNACRSTVGGAGVCIEAPGVNGGNLWKFQLGGHALAVAEFREFDQAQALTLWKDVINKC
ncbi:hypothetical protein HXX76_004114 [Chlamydomonas incerta]|uniref:Class I SAM-dependent methyltransferase n=1 Tax=Chlamydomonas incerta TaxID=51695 RepID=A0A835TAB5_CHLIN|nr:hypothetical protein HXX76_004114 [Chlamydomonas incerta]|eukprot:KAG2439997.1 hypothetical protein HXX76_004114 [Chlamydomonas incerta]